MKIDKLNQLLLDESFMQVDYKGFKFLDKQGEILDLFTKKYKHIQGIFPAKDGGFTIRKNKGEEIKIAGNNIWAHHFNSVSLNNMKKGFVKDAMTIFEIIDVKTVDRIGWRNNFVYEFSESDFDKAKEKINSKFIEGNKKISFEAIILKAKIEGVKLNIISKGVISNRNKSVAGLLFDVDFYKIYKEKPLSVNNIKKELEILSSAIYSKDLLEIFNYLLKK
ncbi:hypothetical protein KAJ61_04355 [Candidatus Parcubacteria bacterium]|nr:hypothetical protein [Candidatus Parcubacteria bacterium]